MKNQVWTMFAAASLGRGISVKQSATDADALLKEYVKRFETPCPDCDGKGNVWREGHGPFNCETCKGSGLKWESR